jgi:hypothetical protein
LRLVKTILWFGAVPLPGERDRLELRGFSIMQNPTSVEINDALLATTLIVVLNCVNGHVRELDVAYEFMSRFADHGIRLVFLGASADETARIRDERLPTIDEHHPWAKSVRYIPSLTGIHFDIFVDCPTGLRWSNVHIQEIGGFEPLEDDERILVARAFSRAHEVKLREIYNGRSGSRVFMADEMRQGGEYASIGHWVQPRLVKIGEREPVFNEVRAMDALSPFVPFELRPNVEAHVEGLRKAVYVADFVDRSESLLDVARAGRAEAAISNLFTRTLYRWRDRANQRAKEFGSLTEAAERLEVASAAWIQEEYLRSELIRRQKLDFAALWAKLGEHKFYYRAATIHGDLHAENVRVRGDDAILIDLGSVRGTTDDGKGAPLSIDVATLEVSLVFKHRGDQDGPDQFDQSDWERQVRRLYELDSILTAPNIGPASGHNFWLLGCLQRIRAFGIYEQSNVFEYPIALVIALVRYCKFQSSSKADKGRRVVALDIAAKLINEIEERKVESSTYSR